MALSRFCCGTPHALAILMRNASSLSGMLKGSRPVSPPVKRSPMAFGWPVMEKGPQPGLARLPVRVSRFMIEMTLCWP